MARKQSAKESIARFINELVKNKHTTLKSITEAAKVGATFGTAFKSLDLLARKNGIIYYAGPYPIPLAKIEKAYRGIREKHNTPKPKPFQHPPPAPIVPPAVDFKDILTCLELLKDAGWKGELELNGVKVIL
jgi:hypothetical protein